MQRGLSKTVIIGGVPRAGKSRLANGLFHRTRATVVHLDTFSNALKGNHPEAFPADSTLDGQLRADPAETVLVKVIRNMGKEFGYLRLFDSSALTPDAVHGRLRGPAYVALFLGYPRVGPASKVRAIREAAVEDPHCWSHGVADNEELLAYVEHFRRVSTQVEARCEAFGIPFFDTGADWTAAVQRAQDFVLSRLSNVNASATPT